MSEEQQKVAPIRINLKKLEVTKRVGRKAQWKHDHRPRKHLGSYSKYVKQADLTPEGVWMEQFYYLRRHYLLKGDYRSSLVPGCKAMRIKIRRKVKGGDVPVGREIAQIMSQEQPPGTSPSVLTSKEPAPVGKLIQNLIVGSTSEENTESRENPPVAEKVKQEETKPLDDASMIEGGDGGVMVLGSLKTKGLAIEQENLSKKAVEFRPALPSGKYQFNNPLPDPSEILSRIPAFVLEDVHEAAPFILDEMSKEGGPRLFVMENYGVYKESKSPREMLESDEENDFCVLRSHLAHELTGKGGSNGGSNIPVSNSAVSFYTTFRVESKRKKKTSDIKAGKSRKILSAKVAKMDRQTDVADLDSLAPSCTEDESSSDESSITDSSSGSSILNETMILDVSDSDEFDSVFNIPQ
ncbi:unnamed protein product [Cyprideis torosa]|uniref:Uncharacterized protein n=1 Tax=Cyprideis torosa TaxID=163714 RepID=A0A7R8W1H8_9CRUS|nr:unnamed protein product [Cyprideis torosa]CAG0880922.1 unnamed protein product [Cyprideis torosa]